MHLLRENIVTVMTKENPNTCRNVSVYFQYKSRALATTQQKPPLIAPWCVWFLSSYTDTVIMNFGDPSSHHSGEMEPVQSKQKKPVKLKRGFNSEACSTRGAIKSRKKVSHAHRDGWDVGPFTAVSEPAGPPCVLAKVDFNQLQGILIGMPTFFKPHVDLLDFSFAQHKSSAFRS